MNPNSSPYMCSNDDDLLYEFIHIQRICYDLAIRFHEIAGSCNHVIDFPTISSLRGIIQSASKLVRDFVHDDLFVVDFDHDLHRSKVFVSRGWPASGQVRLPWTVLSL